MTVKTILAAKGGDVISIEPTATLEAAARKLAEHRIGALLVLGPDRRVTGILSERDIVRVLAEQGAAVLVQPLAQVMTRKVVTCSPSDTVGVLMERMTTGKFRHVPVIDQDQVVVRCQREKFGQRELGQSGLFGAWRVVGCQRLVGADQVESVEAGGPDQLTQGRGTRVFAKAGRQRIVQRHQFDFGGAKKALAE